MGERLRRRGGGDRLGGLLARLGGGDRRLGGKGERFLAGLPRPLLGEPRAGDLSLLGGEGERLLMGEAPLLRGGVSPRRRGGGELGRRRGGESGLRRGGGESGLRRGGGESGLRRGGESGRRRIGDFDFFCTSGDGLRCGDGSLNRVGPSLSLSAPTLSLSGASRLDAAATAFGGGETLCFGANVNFARTIFPSICPPFMYRRAFSASTRFLNSTYPYPRGRLTLRSIASSTWTTSPKLLNISFRCPSLTFLVK